MTHLRLFPLSRMHDRCFDRDEKIARDHWAEFEADVTRLDALITDVNISASDPTLQVRARDGANWTIELADRNRNKASGLSDAMLMPGDSVSVVGRCTQHFGENRIKAANLTINDQKFDLFPGLTENN